MADEFLRIGGRSKNGLAKALITNEDGNLIVSMGTKEQVFNINLEPGSQGIVVNRLTVGDFRQVSIGIDAVGYYDVFGCYIKLNFITDNHKRIVKTKNYQFEKQTYFSTGFVDIVTDLLTIDLTNLREVAQEYNVYLTLRR